MPEQTAAVGLPASTIGSGFIVTITLSTAVEDVPVTVNFNFTEPAVLSAVLGVYTGLFIVALLNEPVPDVVHNEEPFEELPFNDKVALAQIDVVEGPASEVGDTTKTVILKFAGV